MDEMTTTETLLFCLQFHSSRAIFEVCPPRLKLLSQVKFTHITVNRITVRLEGNIG